MMVSCTTLCMGRHSLAKVFEAFLEMDFSRYELAVYEGSLHVSPGEIIEDPNKVAAKLKSVHGLSCGAFYFCEIPADPVVEIARVKGLSKLARLMQVPVVTVLGSPKTGGRNHELGRLRELVSAGASEGVQIALATHVGTWADAPDAAAAMCEDVLGLFLTLDPSHLSEYDFSTKDSLRMLSKVVHTHMRDSTKGSLPIQVRVGRGFVEHAKLITILEKQGYNRLLSIDIHEVPDSGFPVLPEVRKLKYLLESSI